MKEKYKTTGLEVVGIIAVGLSIILTFFALIYAIHYVQEAHVQSQKALDKIFISDLQREYDVKVLTNSLKMLCSHDKRCGWDDAVAEKLK